MAIAGFSQVGVVGAGQMGAGIAQVCASSGLRVTVTDLSSGVLEAASRNIQASAARLCQKGHLTAEQQKLTAEIDYTTDLSRLRDCDLIIEAVIEDEAIKKDLFVRLDQSVSPETVLATNTSSLPVTRLASVTKRADRVIGIHFMNPVPLMRLVEIIPGIATSPEVQSRAVELVTALGKEVSLSRDFPGFVVNRILMPMINEAFAALMEGVASAEDIDKGMKLGTNQPMGPLTLADFIGLDTCLAIMEVLHTGFGDPKYRPCPLLRQYVDAGWLGRKSGRGVYTYNN